MSTLTLQQMAELYDTSAGYERRPTPLGREGFVALDRTMAMVEEEFREFQEAAASLMTAVYQKRSPETIRAAKAHMLKEMCDLIYSTATMADQHALPLDAGLAVVHENNMTKFRFDEALGRYVPVAGKTPAGKVIKPADFKRCEPELEKLV